MNKIHRFYFLGFLFLVACQNNDVDFTFPELDTEISRIENSYAPDTRTAIFTATYYKSGDRLVIKGETTAPDAKLNLISFINSQFPDYVDSMQVLPEASIRETPWGIVNLSVVNLRGKPAHSSEQVTQAILGTPVRVLKKKGGWYYIQTPDKYLAWVDQAAIVAFNEENFQAWRHAKKVIYTGDFGVVAEKSGAESSVVSDIVLGSILKSEGGSNYETKVEFPDGRTGYIPAYQCLDFDIWKTDVQPDSVRLEEIGAGLIGRPYLWGGTSIKGMDCSGFVKTLYFMNGIILNRDASQQVKQGDIVPTEMNFDSLQKGDLLFFGRKATEERPERISHVALYVGDSKYIHSSGMVKINSLDPDHPLYSEYLVDIFVRAKRILGSDNQLSNHISQHNWY